MKNRLAKILVVISLLLVRLPAIGAPSDARNATKAAPSDCKILDYDLIHSAESNELNERKNYSLYKMWSEPTKKNVCPAAIVRVNGSAVEISLEGGEKLNTVSLQRAQQLWGLRSSPLISQSDYRYIKSSNRNDNIWEWFSKTPNCHFARHKLISEPEGKIVQVEAFFVGDEKSSCIIKYRVLIFGVGHSAWTDVNPRREGI